MNCSKYGIPLAPLVANKSHIQEGWVFISNPLDGTEGGVFFLLKTICPPDFQKVDAQIHPNILFDNCRLVKRISTFSEPKVRLSKLAAKQDYVGSVHLTSSAWVHIFSKHTVKETQNFHFLQNRVNTTVRTHEKLSVFIHRDIVVPVVNATLLNPDKFFYHSDGTTQYYEKLFDTEIGHGEKGCHYIARVVTKIESSTGETQLVTAYTLPAFSPSFSNSYLYYE